MMKGWLKKFILRDDGWLCSLQVGRDATRSTVQFTGNNGVSIVACVCVCVCVCVLY